MNIIIYIYLTILFSVDTLASKQKKNKVKKQEVLRKDVQVDFYLYTRSQRTGMKLSNDQLPANYDRRLQNYVLIHGLIGSKDSICMKSIRNALLDHGNYNVIAPNFTNSSLLYSRVHRTVGRKIGNFLRKQRISPNTTHAIAVSLGAHIAGVMQIETGFKPRDIYALDPAGPVFDLMSPSLRLSVDSAEYVLAIHTNAGVLGAISAMGHDDVYANGGNYYPCCQTDLCRHFGSCDILVQSIRSGPFLAKQCQSVQEARTSTCKGPLISLGFGAEPRSDSCISHLSLPRCNGKRPSSRFDSQNSDDGGINDYNSRV